MRLTIRSSLAMRALMFCAVHEGRIVRKRDIALACGASENHLGQVIHRLSQLGYLHTIRGRAGGVRLARHMDDVRVGQVLRLFEARLPFAPCFADGGRSCPLSPACRLRPALEAAMSSFYDALVPVTLRDLVEGNDGLQDILSAPSEDGPSARVSGRARSVANCGGVVMGAH